MFNYRTLAVIKRELREKLLSKAFISMTIAVPVIMIGIIGFQTFIATYEGDENTRIQIAAESQELMNDIKSEFSQLEITQKGKYSFSYKLIQSGSIDNYVNNIKERLLNEELNGLVYIPDSALVNKDIKYYSKTPSNVSVFEKLDPPINRVLLKKYFDEKGLNDTDLSFARKKVDFAGYKVSSEEGVKKEGYGNIILAYLFTFLLYLSLILMGSMVMQSVIEEKSNRIVEILLSSVNGKELMTGKILGASITGVMQMAIWLLPVVAVVSTSIFVLPPEFILDIELTTLAYFLLNFFIGLVTFLGLFAMVGSIFETPQDAQSGMGPVMLLIIIPFFIALTMAKNPANPIAEIASMFPFAAIIVMPAKMTIVEIPSWQLILSFVVNIATLLAIFPIAGKIYRIGIMVTGKKPKWSEVARWLKQE
jgi:ABC-2 type transport system permease protein